MSFVKLVPLGYRLDVDKEFTDFVRRRLDGEVASKWRRLKIRSLLLKIDFGVLETSPEQVSIDSTTELVILREMGAYHSLLNPVTESSFNLVKETKQE